MFGGNKPELVKSETSRLPALPILRPLTDLAVRAHGTVIEVPEGMLLQRCMEMGLLPGAHTQLFRAETPCCYPSMEVERRFQERMQRTYLLSEPEQCSDGAGRIVEWLKNIRYNINRLRGSVLTLMYHSFDTNAVAVKGLSSASAGLVGG